MAKRDPPIREATTAIAGGVGGQQPHLAVGDEHAVVVGVVVPHQFVHLRHKAGVVLRLDQARELQVSLAMEELDFFRAQGRIC